MAQTFGLTHWNRTARRTPHGASSPPGDPPGPRAPELHRHPADPGRRQGRQNDPQDRLRGEDGTDAEPVSPAVIPTPSATPRICGTLARKPNRAPDVVRRMTFGPGVKSPRKTKRYRGSITRARKKVAQTIRARSAVKRVGVRSTTHPRSSGIRSRSRVVPGARVPPPAQARRPPASGRPLSPETPRFAPGPRLLRRWRSTSCPDIAPRSSRISRASRAPCR
jgi:hypothetical protein